MVYLRYASSCTPSFASLFEGSASSCRHQCAILQPHSSTISCLSIASSQPWNPCALYTEPHGRLRRQSERLISDVSQVCNGAAYMSAFKNERSPSRIKLSQAFLSSCSNVCDEAHKSPYRDMSSPTASLKEARCLASYAHVLPRHEHIRMYMSDQRNASQID